MISERGEDFFFLAFNQADVFHYRRRDLRIFPILVFLPEHLLEPWWKPRREVRSGKTTEEIADHFVVNLSN